MASDIGVLGLGVMGSSIALNIADHGYRVAVHNRNWEKTEAFLKNVNDAQQVTGFEGIADFVAELKSLLSNNNT